VAELASWLQVGDDAVTELAEAGDLPGRKLAGEWRFAREAVLDWLAQR
jgi:excisionase family DNA binding protein